MSNALMFIMYPSKNDANVTISTRIGRSKGEPTYAPEINLEILDGTKMNDSMLIVKAVCRNCRTWEGGELDLKSKKQEMIYAFGHGNRLNSDSQEANLKRHIRYGHFEMDMLTATGVGGVPAPSQALNGVRMQGDMVRDHDRANLAHAIMGCLALFVIWPLNVLVAGFFKNIKIHIGLTVGVMAFLVISYGLGISTSAQYNRVSTKSPALFTFSIVPSISLQEPILTPNPVKRLHHPTPNLRLHRPPPHPPPLPPPHPLPISPSCPPPTPPHTPNIPNFPPPDHNRRSRPPSLRASTPRYSRVHRRLAASIHVLSASHHLC